MPVPLPFVYCDTIISTKRRFCVNRIYGALATNPTTQAAVNQIANDMGGALGDAFGAMLAVDCKFEGVHVRFLNAGLDLEADSATGAESGTVDGDPLPDEVCAIIQKRTGVPGRDKRGRYFFSGLSEEGNDDGVLVGDTKDAVAGLAAILGADIALTGNTWHQRHYDRKTNALVVLTQCRPIITLGSRRDRRRPLILNPF